MIGQRRVASLQIGAIKHSKTSLMGHQGAMESSLCSPSCYIIIYVHMLVYSILMWYNSPEDCSFYFFLCTLMLLLKVQNPAGSMLYAPFNPRKKNIPFGTTALKKGDLILRNRSYSVVYCGFSGQKQVMMLTSSTGQASVGTKTSFLAHFWRNISSSKDEILHFILSITL